MITLNFQYFVVFVVVCSNLAGFMWGAVSSVFGYRTENFFIFFLFLSEVVTREDYLPSEHPELLYASMWFAQYWQCDICTSRDRMLWVTDVVTN